MANNRLTSCLNLQKLQELFTGILIKIGFSNIFCQFLYHFWTQFKIQFLKDSWSILACPSSTSLFWSSLVHFLTINVGALLSLYKPLYQILLFFPLILNVKREEISSIHSSLLILLKSGRR